MFFIKEINAKEDLKLMDDIVRHENEVFGDASVGRWNIKPFAKYGKVFVVVKSNMEKGKEEELELVSAVEVLPSFEPGTAYIYGVSTVPMYERQGHMKRLLEYTMEYLCKMGIANIELTVSVKNVRAQEIYKKLGFQAVEELENEYGENVNRYLMRYTGKNTLIIK